MWAIFKANEGIYFTGIKAPHKNAEPSDITFTTPLIAPLLFTKFDIKIAIVKDTIKNINIFKLYKIPLIFKIVLFNIRKLSINYKNYKCKCE